MKFKALIWANLFRKKARFILTIGSFAVAMFLFGLLAVVKGAFGGAEIAGADRLVTINKVSIIMSMPLAYGERIKRIPGVKSIAHYNWFGGVYQDERNFFPQFVIDVENQRKVFPEMVVPDDQWKKFKEDRQGAIAGRKIAERFGWKVGDRIPLKSSFFGVRDWEFNLDGIYTNEKKGVEDQFWFHWDYFEEKVPERVKGRVGWWTLRVENPDDAVRIAKAIDAEFANSPDETKTDTESNFAANWVKQMGNIEFLILSIGGVVFFTLLLVTGNTMAIAVRERTAELAVLKAIGYSNRFVMFLVLGEALVIAAIGGALGMGLAKLISLRGDPTGGLLPIFFLPNKAVVLGVAIALAIGAASGLLPALGAMRLRVVDALRRV